MLFRLKRIMQNFSEEGNLYLVQYSLSADHKTTYWLKLTTFVAKDDEDAKVCLYDDIICDFEYEQNNEDVVEIAHVKAYKKKGEQ